MLRRDDLHRVFGRNERNDSEVVLRGPKSSLMSFRAMKNRMVFLAFADSRFFRSHFIDGLTHAMNQPCKLLVISHSK